LSPQPGAISSRDVVIQPSRGRVLAPVVIDNKEHRLKIIAVVSALSIALLTGCMVVPHAGQGHGYGKPGHHYGHHRYEHAPPGHWKRRHH